jgi:hypothetical protein
MNDDAKNALISYRTERAAESIKAAQLMIDNAMLTPAMNRIYYSDPILVFYGIFFACMPYSGFRYLSVSVCVRLWQKNKKDKLRGIVSHRRTQTDTDRQLKTNG